MKPPTLWVIRMCSGGRSWLLPMRCEARETARAIAENLGNRREVIYQNEMVTTWTYATFEEWKPAYRWSTTYAAWVRDMSGPQDEGHAGFKIQAGGYYGQIGGQ